MEIKRKIMTKMKNKGPFFPTLAIETLVVISYLNVRNFILDHNVKIGTNLMSSVKIIMTVNANLNSVEISKFPGAESYGSSKTPNAGKKVVVTNFVIYS